MTSFGAIFFVSVVAACLAVAFRREILLTLAAVVLVFIFVGILTIAAKAGSIGTRSVPALPVPGVTITVTPRPVTSPPSRIPLGQAPPGTTSATAPPAPRPTDVATGTLTG